MKTEKLITVKFVSGAVMRVSKSLALPFIEKGEAHPVKKSCLKAFWNKENQLQVNNALLQTHDFSKKQDRNFVHKEDDGKVYAYLFKKERQVIEKYTPEKKETKKLNLLQRIGNYLGLTQFEPKTVIIENEKIKVISYPMYQRFLINA